MNTVNQGHVVSRNYFMRRVSHGAAAPTVHTTQRQEGWCFFSLSVKFLLSDKMF